jgi:hypothetical protein
MLAQASKSGTLEDFEAAHEAVKNAGDNKKARNSHFQARLASAEMHDADTRAIVLAGRDTLDPVKTPPKDSISGNEHIQHKVQERVSPDFVTFTAGVAIRRGYWERPTDGVVETVGDLTITEHGVHNSHIIPLVDHETIDVAAVRRLPDQERAAMAALAIRVTESVPELV